MVPPGLVDEAMRWGYPIKRESGAMRDQDYLGELLRSPTHKRPSAGESLPANKPVRSRDTRSVAMDRISQYIQAFGGASAGTAAVVLSPQPSWKFYDHGRRAAAVTGAPRCTRWARWPITPTC